MSSAIGYSLWLVFDSDSEIYHFLQKQIKKFSKEYQTPPFEPHVTLLGGFCGNQEELMLRTSNLAQILPPVHFKVSDIGSNDTFFQRLFLSITKTDEIIEANKKAQTIFDFYSETYFPHMSLMYGNIDKETILNILRSYDREFVIGKSFFASSIQLWSTNGEVKDWKCLTTIPLKS